MLDFLKSTEPVPKEDEAYIERNTAYNYIVNKKQSAKPLKNTFNLLESKVSHYIRKHWQVDIREKLSINSLGGSSSASQKSKTVTLRNKKRIIKHSSLNWDLFFYQFTKDHFQPNLIWNQTTRNELNEILESQIKQFESDKQLNPDIGMSWNYKEFYVSYPSLSREIKVGDYYLRPLVQRSENFTSSAGSTDTNSMNAMNSIDNAPILFTELNHKYMVEKDVNRRIEILKAMCYIYSLDISEVTVFRSIMYVVNLLDTVLPKERDSILSLLKYLVSNEVFIEILPFLLFFTY